MTITQLDRESIYKGRAFQVERVQLQFPDGRIRPYDLVNHVDSVTVIPVDNHGNILFVSQYRVGADDTLLELPAGVLDPGEAPEICAAREVREETGMAAETLQFLGNFYLAPGYSSEHMFIYLATGLYPDALEQDEDEFIELVSIPAAEALQLAQTGKLRDAKTLAAFMLALPLLTP